jgi:catechol 2,3-dioxygenase
MSTNLTNEAAIHPETRIGHGHLRVADLDRALAFYRDVLGFKVTFYGPTIGVPMALLAAGHYHHHIGLNTMLSRDGTPPPPGHTGLHHLAILYPNRWELARAVKRVLDHGYTFDEFEEHGISQSAYFRDPDGNGLELYYDRPSEQWFDSDGNLVGRAEPFDLSSLLAELDNE